MRSRYAVPIVASLTLTICAVGAIAAGSLYSVAEDARPQLVEYSYGQHADNNLDLYLPASVAVAKPGQALTPTVVLVHGGAWVRGDKEDMQRAAQSVVDLGYVAISVNYRVAPESKWPTQRRDLIAALRWIRAHAPDLHVDTSRMVVLGSSAGGEIAAAALTQGAGSRLARGLITLSAPTDLALVAQDTEATDDADASDLAMIVTRDLIGCEGEECLATIENRSVFDNLDGRDPPSLVFTSDREWVDPQSSIRFHQVALASGVESRLIVFQGRRHGMAYWENAWPIIAEWLGQRMTAAR